MPLISTSELLYAAKKGVYAVGAFNIFNMESAMALLRAAEAEHSPVLLQVWSGFDPDPGIGVLADIAESLAKEAKIPAAIHLDHGMTISHIVKALNRNFQSVMIDGSALPYPENAALTKQVVEIAHSINVPVEGEIGHVGNGEAGADQQDEMVYTDPEEAAAFVKDTGLDFLAVSIGTAHGRYRKAPKLNIDLLKILAGKVNVPLVLHGSSYTPEAELQKAVAGGISKINVATELGDVLIEKVTKDILAGLKASYANMLTQKGYDAMADLAAKKMRLFGSSGKG
jgi:fructose-bisphosphate aldolase class II